MRRPAIMVAALLLISGATLSACRFLAVDTPESFFSRWSLILLPLEYQETFWILLLVPVGTLVVSILRNCIGLPTFGIFMPILMALAFRNTGLFYGLAIFTGVILIGYSVRRAVDSLHLLLVPRLSVILTVIISCFTILAMIGNYYGIRELMAVGLLPFVILTMTVERFFVVVEEKGLRDGLITAIGSAIVAVVSHQLINDRALQSAFFLYPELLLVVAAIQILLGSYTGYRLLEYFRFRKFGMAG